MKKIMILMAAAGMAVLLGGCGQKQNGEEVTTIEVSKDGTIIHTIVDGFNEEIYNAQDLTEMIQTETAEYNAEAGGERITFVGMNVEDGRIRLQLKYASAEDYQAFNEKELFVGTVAQALEQGYDMDVLLKNQDGQTVGEADLSAMGEHHMVIMEEAVNVKVYGKILYFSESMTDNGGRNQMAAQTDTEQPYYLVFK